MFYGPGESDYLSWPLPYGFNAIFYTGSMIGAVTHGDVDPVHAAADTTRVVFDAYNPLGSGGFATMLAPTLADPFIEVYTNRNFLGAPIYPSSFKGDHQPDSERHFSSTPDIFRTLAQGLNYATGGNDVEPGMIDVSPDTIQHYWDFVSGGLGRFVGQSVDTGGKLATGRSDEIEPENVPFVRSFFGRMDGDDKRAEYYRQREEVEAAKAAVKAYRESGRGDEAKQYIDRHPVQVRSIGAFDGAEKELRKIRKAKRAIDLSADLSRAEKFEKLKPLNEAEIRVMSRGRMAYARERAKLLERTP